MKDKNNKTYLISTEQILKDAGQFLHYKDITEQAIKNGLLEVKGKAPWSVLNAVIGRDDINKKGEESVFVRGDIPGYIGLRSFPKKTNYKTYGKNKQDTRKKIHTVVKGSIAEARIIELLSLYGKKDFVCYRPSPDIEGIDLIVKEKDKFDPIYIQIKSTFDYGIERGFVSSIKKEKMIREDRMVVVFTYFDMTDGDIVDDIYCVPMPEFMNLKKEVGKEKRRVFTASLRNKKKDSVWAPYLIEKRELSDRISEILEDLQTNTRKD